MDEFDYQRTVAADPAETNREQEQYPYNAQPWQAEPRPPQQPQYYAPPQQPQPQQYYVQQPMYYQQPVARQEPVPGGGAAKAFAIVSFAAGCISVMITLILLLTIIDRHSSVYVSASVSTVYSIMLAIPGLVFGIVALAKKTRLFAMGLMGVIFNGSLVLMFLISIVSSRL